MRCLKCNRETEGNNVFCAECLAEMEKNPIRPGTTVTLPKRPPSVPRTPVRPQIKPEEQAAKLYSRVRRLRRMVAVLLILVLLLIGTGAYFLTRSDSGFDIGSNYSPMTTTPHPSN